MKKIIVSVFSLCLLLSGCSTLPDTNSVPDSSQENEYKALCCDAQSFSVLFSRNNTAVAGEDGATIYTADEDELNKVEISVIFDGDTTGFDVTQYFLFRAADMESEDGIKYTLYEEMTQSSFGNDTMGGAVYSFTTEDETNYRYEILVDTGMQLVRYSCYFYEGEADAPIMAMTDAIKSYQPSADYYDSHPLIIEGENYTPSPNDGSQPQQPSQSQQQPSKHGGMGNYRIEAAEPLITDLTLYDGGYFSVKLPAGWQI